MKVGIIANNGGNVEFEGGELLRGHTMITLMKDELSWMSRDNTAIFGVALMTALIKEPYQKSKEEPFLVVHKRNWDCF